jgi:hypothetical protein
VVRAEDAYGNEDTNTIEYSGTPASAPSVMILYPNMPDMILTGTDNILWNANDDDDGTDLDITIQYSPDGGSSWITLESSPPGPPYNNDGLCPWDTTTDGDGVEYLVRVEAIDSDLNVGVDISDNPFSVDNIVDDEWFFQVQSSGLNEDLDMKPVELTPNVAQSADITAPGQYFLGTWETTKTFTAANVNGDWTFNVFGFSSNTDMTGELYAKVFASSDLVTPLDVTVNDNEDAGAYSSTHLFSWTDTLGGVIPNGDSLIVEMWLDVTVGSGGSLSTTYNYVGATTAGPHDAYRCDVDAMPPDGVGNINSQDEATNAEYIQISASDDSRWVTQDPGAGDEMFIWCDMNVAEAPASITQIDLTFEGQGNQATAWQLWALDQVAASWTQIGTESAIIAADTDTTFTRSISVNPGDFVSGAGVLSWGCYQVDASDLIRVDYLEATVQSFVPPPVFNMEIDFGDTQSKVLPAIDYGGVPTYDIDLSGVAPGTWVFVSFPIDATGNVPTLFNDAGWGDGGTSWDYAQWFDNLAKEWKTYSTAKPPSLNDMSIRDCEDGFWLHITANGGDQLLTVGSGIFAAGPVFINLYDGWNLVGYPSATPRQGTATLPAQADTVSIYDLGQPYRILDQAPGAVTFTESNAYWVHVTADCIWQVDP